MHAFSNQPRPPILFPSYPSHSLTLPLSPLSPSPPIPLSPYPPIPPLSLYLLPFLSFPYPFSFSLTGPWSPTRSHHGFLKIGINVTTGAE